MSQTDLETVEKYNKTHAFGHPLWVWTLYAAHIGYAHYKVGPVSNFDIVVAVQDHAIENPDAWASFVAAQRIYNRNLGTP